MTPAGDLRVETERAASVLDRCLEVLEQRRVRVHEEIERTPAPIPACDEHFNQLLAERGRITRALARLRACEVSTLAECRRIVEELLATTDMGEETSARLRSCACEEAR